MDDPVDGMLGQRPLDGSRVEHGRPDERDTRRDAPLLPTAQVVEHDRPVPALPQRLQDVPADVPGPAGEKPRLHGPFLSARADLAGRPAQLGRCCGAFWAVLAGSRSTVSPRTSSMRASSSGGTVTPTAFTFSCTCSGRDAPMMAAETLSFCSTQATASWAWVSPSSFATGSRSAHPLQHRRRS